MAVSATTDATSVSVAAGSACASRTGGTVVCWGDGFFGQLGNGATASYARPVAIPW